MVIKNIKSNDEIHVLMIYNVIGNSNILLISSAKTKLKTLFMAYNGLVGMLLAILHFEE